MQANVEDIKNHVNSQVIDFKKIRGPVLFRDKIPRNNVGKLVRHNLGKWAREEIQI